MQNETTITKLQQGKTKLQLLKLTCEDVGTDGIPTDLGIIKYQVRLNRKRIKTSFSEYEMRKLFASIAINIVTQLKLYL